MTVVAVCEAPGTAASTTTSLLLASTVPSGQAVVVAECDSSGGDVASWAQLRETPGWSTAVAAGDRSWAGLARHLQQVPSGLRVLTAPSHAGQARVVVREAATRFGGLLGSMSDLVTFADCGRVEGELPAWVGVGELTVVVVRQSSTSAPATVARIDRAGELVGLLHRSEVRVGLVVVGARPYRPDELARAVHGELLGVLPDDPSGAGLVAGAWTLGRGASRSPLARAARDVSARLVDAVGGVAPVVALGSGRGREAAG